MISSNGQPPAPTTIDLIRHKLGSYVKRAIVKRHVYAEKVCAKGSCRIVLPSERVDFASPLGDSFLSISSHYRQGWFVRQKIYTAEIPNAFVFVGKGVVCDRWLRLVADPGFENRIAYFVQYLELRKFRPKLLRGDYATIYHPYAANFGHWMIDCLPRIITLELAYPQRPIAILMPHTANEFQRETLESVLPPHFTIKYLEPDLWVRTERLLWASPASGLVNFMLPPQYFQQIRARIFARYGLPATHHLTKRIYISRRVAKHRRITNEAALWDLLSQYGFEHVELENLPFREQVTLFHDCEILVGAHGAGLSTSIFSGPIQMIVLYATQTPPNYFYTQAAALGQKHWHVCGTCDSEDADFIVDVDQVRKILDEKLACAI